MRYGNKRQADIILVGAKKILGCSSRTCRGDMDLNTLRSCRDKAKLILLVSMPEDRYSKQRFSQECLVEVDRGKPGVEWWMI